MKIPKLVTQILKRKTELPAARKIKNLDLGVGQSIELLEAIVATKSSAHQLHQDTIYTLQTHVSFLPCAIARHAGLRLLSQLGTIDSQLLMQMYIRFNDFEKAIASGYTHDMTDSKLRVMLQYGAYEELCDIVGSAGGYRPSQAAWNELLQVVLSHRQYGLAKRLWNYKPQGKVPQSTVRQLFILASQSHDLAIVSELEPLIENNMDRALAVNLVGMLKDPQIVLNTLRASPVPIIAGTEPLASNILKLLENLETSQPTHIYNSILKGCFDKYTSLFVFAVYRHFRSVGLEPDVTTTQILANACFRLGNSKLLSYEIWHETVLRGNVVPTRRLLETMLQCQFNGVGVRTSLYFLYEMYTRGIYLRNNVHFKLSAQFGDDIIYKQLYGDMKRRIADHSKWDHELAIVETGRYARQAERNRLAFVQESSLERLKDMMAFEEQRMAQLAQ